MHGDESVESVVEHSAPESATAYGLFEAFLQRRSRRFSRGMEISGGPTAYKSDHPPEPLTEEEQAMLAFAACGITGASLGDWSYASGSGGNMIARSVGRTVSSPDAVHTAAVFVMDDEATWLAPRPQDLAPERLANVIELTRAERYVEAWQTMRVKIADERLVPTTDPPVNIAPNQWSLYAEGTTYFLPVSSITYALINVLLEVLSGKNGFFLLDERRMYRPAGLRDFAKSRGGPLDDDPRNGKAMPLGQGERVVGEFLAVEQGMILQNLGLACQAMGLSGFPNYTMHDEAWFEVLGFRMQTMPLTDFMAVPFPASTMLKLTGQNATMKYPVGLEHEGEPLLRSYMPPYFESMEAAVHAVVDDKFGEDGIYGGGELGVYEHRTAEAGWQSPEHVGANVPNINEDAIEATVAAVEYVWEHYGRFPATYPPFHTLMGFQAGHVDEDFYDHHYRPESLSDTHRSHMQRWHQE